MSLEDVYQPERALGGGYILLEGQFFGVPPRRETKIETWVHEFSEWTLSSILPKIHPIFYHNGKYQRINSVTWTIAFYGVTRKTNIAHLLASLISGTGYHRKKGRKPVEVPAEIFDPKTQSRLPRWTK